MTSRQKRLVGLLVPIQVLFAFLAWRDLGRRSSQQIRGPKLFWRIFVSLNPGNSLVYWLFGRRRVTR